MTTEVWRLLRGWADTRPGGMNDSQIARALDVSSQRVSKWKRGAKPGPEQIRTIAEVTGIPLSVMYAAVLADQGYDDAAETLATAAYPAQSSRGRTDRARQDAETEAADAEGPERGA